MNACRQSTLAYRRSCYSIALICLLMAVSCAGDDGSSDNSDTLTNAQALQVLGEAGNSNEAEQLTGDVIEISTNFTIGAALADAAQEINDLVESQIPCSDVTLVEGTLTIDFGGLDDNCVYNGRTYGGVAAVTVVRTEANALEVHHVYTGLTNGTITLNGTSDVTWTSDMGTQRHIVHNFDWTSQRGSYTGTGDRTMTFIDEAQRLLGGIVINGSRTWTNNDNGQSWTMSISNVEVRLQDPAPQDGVYSLTTPDGLLVTLSFVRRDAQTIRVTLASGERSLVFDITALGQIQEVAEDGAGTEVAEDSASST